ncbi:MAG: class I SAM-dependent methyltransferase [Gammaproteobacteria bacterium]|nr:class I SAM-dependent methyltransferase [Gammaproteobacteria bacterium]
MLEKLIRGSEKEARALFELFARVAEQWERTDAQEAADIGGTGRYVQAAGFDSLEKVVNMRRHYQHWFAHLPDFSASVGCDLGCWLGFSTAIQASLGCRRVYGIEPIENSARLAEQWRVRQAQDRLRFRPMRAGIVPLCSDSIDWVVINQVLCNALPDSFAQTLAEAWRILRPGGQLLFSDANNPYCADALERLRRNFHRAEIGDGTQENPNGPNYRQRLAMIRACVPALDETRAQRLARETCYLYGEAVERAALDYLAGGRTPGSVFQPESLRPTCIARTGASNGNPTDPYELSGRMRALGFETPWITSSPRFEMRDNEAVWEGLCSTQGFFIFARKPPVAGADRERR